MAEHTVLFTPVPNGLATTLGRVRVLVHVGPRLLTDGTLGDYSDWIDWPATVAAMGPWELRFPGLGGNVTVPAELVKETPDSAVWTRLFPSSTPVRARRTPRVTHRLLHSYPTATITQFLAERWGRFGAESPTVSPNFADLLDDDGFGPIAFERLQRDVQETGPQRRKRLVAENQAQLDPADPDPARWAIIHKPLPASPPARRDEIGRRFLELEHFHGRGRRGVQKDILPEKPSKPTFHELVAMVQRYPRLMQVLGLVLVFEAELTPAHYSPAGGIQIQATSSWLPAVQHRPVYARTMCEISADRFRAMPKPNDSDLIGRQLRLGDPRFRVDAVDPDTAALRAMQFADNVARSRPENFDPDARYSAYTEDEFALPATASAGISVTRNERGPQLAQILNAVQQNNDSTFDQWNAPLPPLPGQEPPSPLFWADDLVRGYRWDVKAAADGRWRSLMETEGHYEVGAEGDVTEVDANEEGIAVAGVSSAGGADPGDDLYVQESLMHWGGWSLAVRPPGATVGRDDAVADPDVPIAPDGSPSGPVAPIKARLHAKPGSLPRLRFGEAYSLRARAVDIAGGSDAPDAPTEPTAQSAQVRSVRFEPVSAPLAALRDQPEIPGETNTVIVVRSENAADGTTGQNHRHLLPPRTNIVVAERHGLLDSPQPGQPLDVQALANLGALDAQDLSMHPDIQPAGPAGSTDERWFPVDDLTLNYLPDPLAKRVLVRDLPPGSGGSTEIVLPLALAPWPAWETSGITVNKSDTTTWDQAGNRIVVRLAKGEDRFVVLSSRFDDGDVDLMGVWPWISDWHMSHGGTSASLQALRDTIAKGHHWMFTPSKRLRLVHAVRTPLLAPTLPAAGFSAAKDGTTPAATIARIRWSGAYSRKSTAKLDLLAEWSMKVDNGPRTSPDPTQPQPFSALAASIPLDHRSAGPDSGEFQAIHEFGDTKYRSVGYRAVATSAFTEFFREEADVIVPGPANPGEAAPAIEVDDRGLVASTVVVKDPQTGVAYRQGPAADYTVDEAAGSLVRGPVSSIVTGAALLVSYVVPSIHTESETRIREIRSSARPAAPTVEYVVPSFRWQRQGNVSMRMGNSLRVYLKRPWWSSGDDERLGVVLWRKPTNQVDPPAPIKPYITMWGSDPVFNAPGVSTTPVLSSFPLAVGPVANIQLAELGNVTVDIAPHEVAFDAGRDLWYADIDLDFGISDDAYFPFVRLALVRYQPHSLPGVEISPVVLADFAQVTPQRTVSVTGSGSSRTVQVTGRAYSANSSANEPSRMQVVVERTRPGVDDPNLKWQQVGLPTALGRSVASGNLVTWSGSVSIPSASGPKRLVVEEMEVHKTGTEVLLGSPNGRRIVFTDIIEL
jgi:hypothetical protein